MTLRVPLVAVGVAAVMATAGCGESSSPDLLDARETAEAWIDARNSGNAARVCELYARDIREQIGEAYGGCVNYYKRYAGPVPRGGYFLGKFHESAESATGTVRTRSGKGKVFLYPLDLSRVDGEWRVSAFGAP